MGADPPAGEPPSGTTLFAWVKTSLRAAIARGEYAADQPFVTQREIVERFGVSTTTAVRALNDLVAEGLVVRRRGRGTFVADPAPRREAAPVQGVRTVAFVNPNDVDAHQVSVRSGIAEECAARGHRLVMSSTPDVDSEEAVLRRVVDEGAHGVVVYLRDHSRAGPTLDELRRSGVAVVLVDRYLPSWPSDAVMFDDFAIGYEVTTAVLDRGHRAPGCCGARRTSRACGTGSAATTARCGTVAGRSCPSGRRCATTPRCPVSDARPGSGR